MGRACHCIVVLAVACTSSPAADVPSPQPTGAHVAAAPIDSTAVKAMSRAWFEARDRHDAAALAKDMAASFVRVTEQGVRTRAELLALVKDEHEHEVRPWTRVWHDEEVFLGPSSAVYAADTVEQHEEKAAGWATLVWAREGSGWQIVAEEWISAGLEAERARWNAVFRAGTGFTHEPNHLLAETIKGRTPGRALDLSTGEGRNAIFLAAHGWTVTGVDISEEGLRVAREHADQQKVSLELVDADLDAYDLGKDKWDLVAMIYAGDDAALVGRAAASLRRGGVFVLEYFASDSPSAASAGGWKPGVLAAIFKAGFRILRDEHVEDVADWGQDKDKLVRFVAEKL